MNKQYYIAKKSEFKAIQYPCDYLTQMEINGEIYCIEAVENIDWQNQQTDFKKLDIKNFELKIKEVKDKISILKNEISREDNGDEEKLILLSCKINYLVNQSSK